MSKILVAPWRRLLVVGMAVVASRAQAFVLAQARSDLAPVFEAVSIKPNTSGAMQMIIRTPPSGLMTGTNVSMVMLIRFAYGTFDHRILLADRFGPIVRSCTREMDMDVLTRAGREMGPQLREAAPPCESAAVASGAVVASGPASAASRRGTCRWAISPVDWNS